jgi:hypothetical protein
MQKKLFFDALNNRHVKVIKLTEDFANYLMDKYKPEWLYEDVETINGYVGALTGITIVVDDKINNQYYEFEF